MAGKEQAHLDQLKSLPCAQAVHEQGRQAGIADFVCKPFRIEELQRVLKSTKRVKRAIEESRRC